jgi:hypothetical protein
VKLNLPEDSKDCAEAIGIRARRSRPSSTSTSALRNRRPRTVGELIQERSGVASTAWSASSASG